MKRSVRCLWQFTWPNLMILAGAAGVITLLTAWFGRASRPEADNMISIYFGMFPLMAVLIIFLLATNLSTINLGMALSMGGRRRDYFWAMQGAFLLYTMAAWGISLLLGMIPGLLHWRGQEQWRILLSLGNQPWWWYPLICMTAVAVGASLGMLMVRSKVLAVIYGFLAGAVGVAAVVFLMLSTFNDIHLWGDMPWIIPLVLTAMLLLCEWLLWRYIQNYCVR